jgi:hypothetical protein
MTRAKSTTIPVPPSGNVTDPPSDHTAPVQSPIPVPPRQRVPLDPVAQQAQMERDAAAMAAMSPEQVILRNGRERKPFSHVERRLNYDQRPGFVRRWFNDVTNRIERAQAAGYEHVKDNHTGTPMKATTGVHPHGGPLTSYLMEIPEEFYDADFAAKQESLNELDRAIYRDTLLNSKLGENRASYTPRHSPMQIGEQRPPTR